MTIQGSSEGLGDSNELAQAEALARAVFGDIDDLDSPLPGMSDTDEVATNIHDMIYDPGNTVVVLKEDNQPVGFSVAVPYEKMKMEGPDKTKDTAYIYYTGIEPSRQHEGLVKRVNDDMIEKLKAKGYKFAVRDTMMDDDYARKVEEAYDRAIVERYSHTRWPDVGPQRFFRIDLSLL